MQQISADVFPFAIGAENARYYRATALRVGVSCRPAVFVAVFAFGGSDHGTESDSAAVQSPPGCPSGQMGSQAG